MCRYYWPWQGTTSVYGETIEVKFLGGGATKHHTVRYIKVTDKEVSYPISRANSHVAMCHIKVCVVCKQPGQIPSCYIIIQLL